MPTDVVKPGQSLPSSLAKRLQKLGFTDKALQALTSTLRGAHEQHKLLSTPAPTTTQPRTPKR